MKDGKFIPANKVPEVWKRIAQRLDVFDGSEATHQRLIGGMMVYLSDENYYKETVGSITGYLKKEGIIQNGTH